MCSNSSNSKSTETEETSKALKITIQCIIGLTVIIVVLGSIMDISSIANLWLMINQNQMFFLLILTRAFIPNNIVVVITGLDFTINPLTYIPLIKIGIYKSVVENFDFGLSNSLLDPLGFKSDSTAYNNATNFISLVFMIILHLFIYLLNRFLSNCAENGSCSWLAKIIVRTVKKAFEIMSFGYN